MAKGTPKRKTSAGSKKAENGGSILSFFNKAPPARKTSDISALEVDAGVSSSAQRSSIRKGKERAVYGASAADPVVISDDEVLGLPQPAAAKRVKRSPPPVVADDVVVEVGSSPIGSPTLGTDSTAGPSCRPRRSCSPRPILAQQKPDPFPTLPGFQPPSTWPEVINTARDPDDDDDDDTPPSDPEMGRDDDVQTQEPQDDEDDPEEEDIGAGDIQLMDPPAAVRQGPDTASIDLTVGWEDEADEGMGMDSDAEETASEVLATPPPRFLRAKGGKVDSCPVCGASLRSKPPSVAQQHINDCHDTPGSPGSASRTTGRDVRPISSFAAFSPAATPSPEPEPVTRGPNAFSVLMSGHKEKEQWRDAEIDLKRDGKRVSGRRKAPFYKVMTGMPVAVDAFRYGAVPKVTAYLLTHAHSDHYTNLSKSWTHGPIYCSITTANLIIHMLGVEPKWVHGLPDNIPFEMPNTGGVKVTPIEANHCPGSSLFLFEGPQTVNAGDSTIRSPYVGSKRVFRYLHCGDFRACPRHVLHPAIARARIDTCYLDTTYLNPKYCFPPQPQVIAACASLARKTALGISADAPPIEDFKPDIKPVMQQESYGDDEDIKPDVIEDLPDPALPSTEDVKPDIKPQTSYDPHAEAVLSEERSKAMMSGWLVKKESGDDVKEEWREVDDVKPKIKGRTLIVMGTYSIGKERIVKAVARALGSKIYCDPRKKGILLCQTDPDLHAMLSADPIEAQVHLLPLGNIQVDRLQPYLARLHPHFDRILGFRPTGWTYTPPAGTDMLPDVNTVIRRDQARTFTDVSLKPMRGSCRQYMMYGVPYSEHSSFFELTCFALSLPGPDTRMIATVNVGNEKSRARMKKWFEKWQAEKVKRREKKLPEVVDYRDESYW